MSDERPDALLKSALEKIVYFEARAQQLHGELANARDELSHLREDLAQAHQRELDLRRELAELEVRSGRALGEREELTRLNHALRLERNQLMEKLLDASRIHSSGQPRGASDDDDDELGFDLASFISQLRSEVILRNDTVPPVRTPMRGPAVPLKTPEPQVPWTERPAPPVPQRASAAYVAGDAGLSPVAREAQRLQNEGRLRVSPEQMAELSGHAGSPTDETLFGFSVRELSAADAAARVRAAERLKALAHPAAAPALAAALHAETDAMAQVALLQAFAGLCREEGASVVSPLLSSPVPEVRIAALKALLVLAPRDAAPHLAQAMKDSDRSVRRRASLLALGLEGETARRLGEDAIHDTDSEVRALAALALGAGRGENARALLLEALDDREVRVRKAAAQSLSRILGQDVSAVVALEDTHRRREIRRLATLPVKPVRATLEVKAVAPVVAQRANGAQAVGVVAPQVMSAAQQVNGAQAMHAAPQANLNVAPVAANAAQWATVAVAPQAVSAAHQANAARQAVLDAAQQALSIAQAANATQQANVNAAQAAVNVARQAVANASSRVAVDAAQPSPAANAVPAMAVHAAQQPLAAQASNDSQWTVAPMAAPALAVATVGVARGAPSVMQGAVPARAANGGPVSFASAPAPSRPVASVPAAPPPAQAPSVRLTPVQAALVAMGAPPPTRIPAPPVTPPVPPRRGPSPVEALCGAMLQEVRVAVRGRSLPELTAGLSAPAELAQEAVALLVARGAIVRRGHKYFAA
ncbi:HEAT repeat domain-containing protein [Corallococcus sp. BB11-1]|uniref:HEAT repeat domain-containing protein n=1 Tax=Corallococcus sp. BB11-1 TaxID=2996783 RepID=UPI0022717985|nr:HEAT repeat domain-containing protein [Corallococcus sp. BB11-1]MCY1030517.1 HEAT repeat domain-containing protein [Corallococcus sp. BB11-1]